MFEERQALFDSKELFSAGEAARILDVCTKTLRDWTRAGLLESRQAKAKHYYPKEAIKRFLMQQQSITPPAIALEGTTKELVRPDFNMEMIADVIAK
jgi:Helix-turn-helix domain